MTRSCSEDTARLLLIYLATGLAAGGMPAHEVEDDLRTVAGRIGYPDAQVDAAPTSVRLRLGPGEPATFEAVEGGLRLDQLAEVTEIEVGLLSRRLAPEDALQRLRTLRRRPHRYSLVGIYAGGFLVSAGLALVLHPALTSVVFALVVSPLVTSLIVLAGKSRTISTLLPLIAALPVALLAFAAADLGWVDGPLRALLPPLAVLLPGALMVTGLSELAAGAMVAGSARLAFGTTQLLLFAVGVAGAVLALQPPMSQLTTARADQFGWWALPLGVLAVTLGIALMESVPLPSVPWVLCVIALTAATQAFGQGPLGSAWAGAFLGGVAASLGSSVVEFLRPHLSRVVVFLPSFWLLVPGSLSLLSLTQYETNPRAAADALLLAAGMMVAIALGVIVGASVARSLRRVARRTGLRRVLQRLPRRRQAR